MPADHYETLGVPRDADAAEIKRAHRRAVNEHHPDKGGDREKFDEVQTAWLVLKDPDARARYDRGEDPRTGPDNRTAMVTQMAIKAFMEAATSGDIEYDDLVRVARRDLEQQADKAALAIEKLAEQKDTWEETLGRITRDESVGPNFLRQAVERQIRDIEDESRRISEHAGKIADAVEMLEGFEYRTDEREVTLGAWQTWNPSEGSKAASMAALMAAAAAQQHDDAYFRAIFDPKPKP